MLTHVILVYTIWLLSSCSAHDVHTLMTIDELKSTFNVDDHSLVPEYEIVNVHHVRRRSISPTQQNSIHNTVQDNVKKGQSKEPHAKNTAPFTDNKTVLRLHAFGKPLNLNLVRTEGLFSNGGLKIWHVEPNATSQHGVEYVEIPQEKEEDIGHIYQDTDNQAAILIRSSDVDDGIVVEGSIGSDIVIRPVPARLHDNANLTATTTTTTTTTTTAPPPTSTNATDAAADEDGDASDDEMFLDDDGELSSEVAIDTGLPIKRKNKAAAATVVTAQTQKHIVFKRKDPQDETLSDYAFMEPDHLAKRYRRSLSEGTERSKRRRREAPYTIYPEILVIVDYDGYRLHGGDNQQIKRYFVSFWNGVDLRYKLLKGPKVRISIAGIIISRGRDATPYLEKNRVGTDAIDSAAALTDMGKYLFRERRLPVYDIAVAITKYDMCRRRKGGRCTKGTAGFAYVGGACVVNKRLEKVNSVAIIEDTGGFSGIIVAAHEVGHLLGAVHDGSPPPSYLGGPGAEKCQWTDGFIMSDLRHTERGFRWSPCSVSSFHHFLNGDTATCLYNTPHEDGSLPRVLPGKLLTLDAQCRRDRGTSACFKDDRVCAQLFCFDSGSGYCVAYRPAAEGSPCGDGQYCMNGKCAAEHENIIPDYSQNTPSYIRGSGNVQGRPLFYDDGEENYQNNQAYPPNTYSEYTTLPPYPYYPQQQPEEPYNNPYSTNPPAPPQNYYYNVYSTTKSPYNFESFGKQSTAGYYSSTQSTQNPYVGNYYQLIQQTTKNPYDFGHFGQTTNKNPYTLNYHDNINNNYLKRSYNTASYYSDSSNVRNVTANFNNRRIIGG